MNSGFKVNQIDDLVFLTIPAFEETGLVKHCFTTRLGGISEGIYTNLNTSVFKEDSEENVLKNLDTVCRAINIDYRKLAGTRQLHSDKSYLVSESDMGRGVINEGNPIMVDALITDKPGVPLITYYADCVPVYILDTVNKAIALIHSGWKGTVQKIAQKTLQNMQQMFNTDPKKCLIGIGPSLEQDCFEVDADVAFQFKRAFYYANDFISIDNIKGKSYIDLWGINAQMLMEIGVQSDNITISGFCTRCRADLFFSYRRDKGRTGSLSAIMELI